MKCSSARKGNRSDLGGFSQLDNELLDSPAWLTASLGARCVVWAILRQHTGKNNGRIVFSHRQIMANLRCGDHQAGRYVREAQDRGFLEAMQSGSFHWKTGAGAGKATTWRLTMKPCAGKSPTDDWRTWEPAENSESGCRSGNGTVAAPATIAPIGCRSGNRYAPKAVADVAALLKTKSSLPGWGNSTLRSKRR